jgi:hypothetical protein
MENLLAIGQIRVKDELEGLRAEVEAECAAAGLYKAVIVPEPPLWVANEEPCPVFVRFHDAEACKKVKEIMNGRQFELNTVTAKFIGEELWDRVAQGEWVDHKLIIDNPTGPAQMNNPGAVNHYPNLLPQALTGAGYAVAGQHGAAPGGQPAQGASGYVVRMSKLPKDVAKFDIVRFLEGCQVGEGHVRLVKNPDGEMNGEAFVDCPSAESVARACAFDRTQMGASGVFVSVVNSSVEERNAITNEGLKLV